MSLLMDTNRGYLRHLGTETTTTTSDLCVQNHGKCHPSNC